ncbi:MAG: PspC domain-containing protein [Sphingomicrobium sp.]
MNGRFLLNRRDAKVMGVAAGLGDYTGIDPSRSASRWSSQR